MKRILAVLVLASMALGCGGGGTKKGYTIAFVPKIKRT